MGKVDDRATTLGWNSSLFGTRRCWTLILVFIGLSSVVVMWQLAVELNFGRYLQTSLKSTRVFQSEKKTAHNDTLPPDFHQPVVKERVTNISTTPKTKLSSKPLVALLWTGSVTDWFSGGISVDLMDECYTQGVLTKDQVCEFTHDRSRLQNADAVLFRARDLKFKDRPKKREARQHYVMYEIEPPHKTWRFNNLTKFNGFYNITSTYAWDSDIPLRYHRNFMVDSAKYEAVKDVDFAAKKRTDVPVAWFVSRCPTQSNREGYVKEMQKYIGVDVYGRCGTLTCKITGKYFDDDDCVETLLNGNNSYKFYLAFENSLCEDYVTEKIWKVMKAKVVPVVMGAVDYKRMFPPKTIINVRDFKSPKDLANFLLYLHGNNAEYNNYMRRKAALSVSVVGQRKLQCLFCKGLHDYRGKKSIVYALDEFWSVKRCIRPNVFFEYHKPDDFGIDLDDIDRALLHPKRSKVVKKSKSN